jgi:hypothetical protein
MRVCCRGLAGVGATGRGENGVRAHGAKRRSHGPADCACAAPRGSAPKSFLREGLKPKAETAAARFTKARPELTARERYSPTFCRLIPAPLRFVGHGGAPVSSEVANPSSSKQETSLRHRRRSLLYRERFSPVTPSRLPTVRRSRAENVAGSTCHAPFPCDLDRRTLGEKSLGARRCDGAATLSRSLGAIHDQTGHVASGRRQRLCGDLPVHCSRAVGGERRKPKLLFE